MDMLLLDQAQMSYGQAHSTSSVNLSSIYLQDFRSEPCQVCGENASGWHCGSITCEACKKFFLRSVNDEYRKYKCMKDKQCLITRSTRTQCQYCRYAKCISVGMKLSEGNPNLKIEDIFKQIPCAVCHHASSGIHFGATTCEGCKGFFRRTMRERIPQQYKCADNNNCVISHSTRNACRACRFQKCLRAGMSMDGSRIGRQSNLFKHKMVELQRQGLIRSQLRQVIALNTASYQLHSSSRKPGNNARRRVAIHVEPDDEDLSSYVESAMVLRFENKLEPQVFQQISEMENAYVKYLRELPFCSTDTNDLWLTCLSQLNEYTSRVGDFTLSVPEFYTLSCDDKNLLVHLSMHSIILFCLCLQSARFRALGTDVHWNYLNVSIDSTSAQHLQHTFPFLFDVNQWLRSLEKGLQWLELDDKEVALFLTLLLTSPANSKCIDTEKIEKIEEDTFCILHDYMSAKRGVHSNDYFILTVQIPLIHRINSIISTHLVPFTSSSSL